MREILFRGQKICHPWNSDYLEWQYGDLMTNEDDYPQIYSHDGTCAKVLMKTVGQFTGLTDKNGKRIFEGDVMRIPGGYTYVIRWSEKDKRFEAVVAGIIHGLSDYFLDSADEVIGNIYDNPELSEAGT